VQHLDFTFTFASPQDIDKFSSYICGYYRHVSLNKKRLYEEFGQLLDEIYFISI